jgi:predicted SAM-dependent methyltransferase
VVEKMIKISPYGKEITDGEMLSIFNSNGAHRESIFRRYEMNEVIEYTKGVGVDIGCGLNKIHSTAIGIDKRMSLSDFGYPFGAQIRASGETLPWFEDNSLDFVFSSHCLEHMADPFSTLKEWHRVLKPAGYLVLIMPRKDRYPPVGSPGANQDHKRDFLPEDVIYSLEKVGAFQILQKDTLVEKLKENQWAIDEATKYGHNTLNFSFEIVAKKMR